jgi:cellulose synthase/poly-beta-1,6-N-acetylglucosamine synthase-like glycosyltransferase
MIAITVLSTATLLIVLLPVCYLLFLALASIRDAPASASREPSTRFAIVIPAHDEASVIAATVGRLCGLEYPAELFTIHVVADHCSDETAALARQAGAIVHERKDGPRSGKGA